MQQPSNPVRGLPVCLIEVLQEAETFGSDGARDSSVAHVAFRAVSRLAVVETDVALRSTQAKAWILIPMLKLAVCHFLLPEGESGPRAWTSAVTRCTPPVLTASSFIEEVLGWQGFWFNSIQQVVPA